MADRPLLVATPLTWNGRYGTPVHFLQPLHVFDVLCFVVFENAHAQKKKIDNRSLSLCTFPPFVLPSVGLALVFHLAVLSFVDLCYGVSSPNRQLIAIHK